MKTIWIVFQIQYKMLITCGVYDSQEKALDACVRPDQYIFETQMNKTITPDVLENYPFDRKTQELKKSYGYSTVEMLVLHIMCFISFASAVFVICKAGAK